MLPFSVVSSMTLLGVRGNHDQQIIEWRSWFNWVRSFPDGPEWIENYADDRFRAVPKFYLNTSPSSTSLRKHTDKYPFPDNWKWASQHWRLARDMTDEHYRYLLSLPLVLHIPSLHTLVVHAGILPVDPKRSITSNHQPLARIPVLGIGQRASEKELRSAQEVSVVTDM